MKPILTASALGLAASMAAPLPASAFEGVLTLFDGRNDLSAQMGSASNMKAKRNAYAVAPPAGYQGQWYTTADGCSYSRAGGGWFLILNPHHIGQPNAHKGCVAHIGHR